MICKNDPKVFDFRVFGMLRDVLIGVCNNVDTDVYGLDSLRGICSLESMFEQNVVSLNLALVNGNVITAANQTRVLLENLSALYYIFKYSNRWNYRAKSYYYARCQSLWKMWKSQLKSERIHDDISDSQLFLLNKLRYLFFSNFRDEPNSGVPSYVHYFDLSKNGSHPWYRSDYILRYPWNKDSFFDVRNSNLHYGVSWFMNDLGMFGAYSHLYTELSSYVHGSSNIDLGSVIKVSDNEFKFSPTWAYYPVWLVMLFSISIRLSEEILICIYNDDRCVNRRAIIDHLSSSTRFLIREVERDYSISDVMCLIFTHQKRIKTSTRRPTNKCK